MTLTALSYVGPVSSSFRVPHPSLTSSAYETYEPPFHLLSCRKAVNPSASGRCMYHEQARTEKCMPAAVILNLMASNPLSIVLFFPIVYGTLSYHVCQEALHSSRRSPRYT